MARDAKCPSPGTTVKWSRKFLQSTGQYAGPVPHAVGEVLSVDECLRRYGDAKDDYDAPVCGSLRGNYTLVKWDYRDAPVLVACANLIEKGRREP